VTINVIDPPVPPVVSLNVQETWIEPGGSTNIWWDTQYADSCVLDPNSESLQLHGSQIIAPSETTTYTLTATGPGGTATATINVKVAYFPPTVEFTVDSNTIEVGQSATLFWSSTRAQTASIEPGIGNVDTSGSITVTPPQTTPYTITVTGPGGTVSSSITVYVIDPSIPPTVNFTAVPEHIQPGQTAVLSWNSANAAACSIEPGIGNVEPGGSLEVSPQQTTQYIITATGPAGSTTAAAAVGVGTASQTRIRYEYDELGRIKRIIRETLE